jgi:nucleoside-diphosphate-sugar epimerase
MERLINANHERYLICRLPQAVGRSANRTTLVNYFYDKIVANAEFTIWKSGFRYLIDIDDTACIVSHIIDRGSYRHRILNICALRYSVEDVVRTLEEVTRKKALHVVVEKGASYVIDNSDIAPTIK